MQNEVKKLNDVRSLLQDERWPSFESLIDDRIAQLFCQFKNADTKNLTDIQSRVSELERVKTYPRQYVLEAEESNV